MGRSLAASRIPLRDSLPPGSHTLANPLQASRIPASLILASSLIQGSPTRGNRNQRRLTLVSRIRASPTLVRLTRDSHIPDGPIPVSRIPVSIRPPSGSRFRWGSVRFSKLSG
jgi:hypothetical protein